MSLFDDDEGSDGTIPFIIFAVVFGALTYVFGEVAIWLGFIFIILLMIYLYFKELW